jgi:anti-anti-sigma factor
MNDNFAIVKPEGILDKIQEGILRQDVLKIIETPTKVILVDLEDISFMNSSGMGTLVATLKSVRAAGGDIYLCSLCDQIRIIFELTKIDLIFKIFRDRQDFETQYATMVNFK